MTTVRNGTKTLRTQEECFDTCGMLLCSFTQQGRKSLCRKLVPCPPTPTPILVVRGPAGGRDLKGPPNS